MSLSIDVGVLADLLANDAEGAAWFEQSLATLDRVLASERLPRHVEPRVAPPPPRSSLVSIPVAALHHLRRAYAHRLRDPAWIATPFPTDADPADDAQVEALTEQFESHLLCHSDSEGFYLPIDFRDIVFSNEQDDLPGGMVGSSHRLLDELRVVAPALGIALVDGALADAEAARIDALDRSAPSWAEQAAWLALFEAARLSITHKTAIVFG